MRHCTPGALSIFPSVSVGSWRRNRPLDIQLRYAVAPSTYKGGFREMPRWRVDIIRKRAEHLGTVEAATEKEAIEKAAKRFDIPPDRRNRITVQKISKNRD